MLFGAQVKQAGGLLAALRRAEAMGAEVMQVFAQSPRQWRYPEANAERAAVFADAWPASTVVRGVVCHAPYLINLGTANDEIYDKSCASLAENLRAAGAMGAAGLVVHIGSHLGAGLDARLDAIASGMRCALDQADCPLLLENTAGAGGTIGRSFAELARVIEHADGDPRLGICLDTQHAWAAGMSSAPSTGRTRWSRRSTAPWASTVSPASTSTTPRPPGGPVSTATRTSAEGRWARPRFGLSSVTPAYKGFRPSSRCRAPTSRAPTPGS